MDLHLAVNGGPTDEYKKMRMELNKRCVASGLIKDPSVQKGRGATAARPKRVVFGWRMWMSFPPTLM